MRPFILAATDNTLDLCQDPDGLCENGGPIAWVTAITYWMIFVEPKYCDNHDVTIACRSGIKPAADNCDKRTSDLYMPRLARVGLDSASFPSDDTYKNIL